MRQPRDAESRSAAVGTAAAGSEGEQAKPPGGKAFRRLTAFMAERGFAFSPDPTTSQGELSGMAALYANVADNLQGRSAAPSPPGSVAAGRKMPAGPAGGPAAPAWRSIGPVMMPNGQTYGSGRIDVSGRLAAIAVDPSNRNHILAGSAGGGVWESRDFGATWSPRTDHMPTLTVGAIAFNPAAPATVYCGTGEGNFYASLGAGLLRSTDGGTNWALLASSPFVGQGFHDLVVDPAAGVHLVAATTGGVYVSTNGGTGWIQALSGTAWGLAVHPAGGPHAEWLAASWDGLRRSPDGGQTWALVALPGAPPSWNRLDVAVARSNPSIAYAFGASGATVYLYRRDAGGAWQSIAPLPTDLTTAQAWYDWYIEAAPDKDGQIYLAGIDLYRGDLDGAAWTWTDLSSKSSGDSIHPDQHAMTFDPTDPNTVYAGSDGGLFRSPNRGLNWTSLNNGLAITEIEYLAQDYGSSRWLFGGTQDNGSIRYTGSPIWEHAADGDGGDCGVDHSDPNIVFHTFYSMGMERSTAKGAFNTFAATGPAVPQNPNAYPFYAPVAVNNKTVAQADQSVWVSRDGGSTWLSIALPGGPTASALDAPTTDQLFVGTINGRLFQITWSGGAWSAPKELSQPRGNAYISEISVDAAALKRIWITSSSVRGGRVFRSDDGGQHWIDCSTGLPPLPINSVEVDPADANRLWVAADLGVYQSTDGGAHWQAFSLGLPNALVEDLVLHPYARVLRAATRNRGVWEIPVDGWMTAPVCGTQWTGTLAASAHQQWSTFNWPATWHVVWTVMPTTPYAAGAELSWEVTVQRAGPEFVTYWIQVKNLTSAPVAFEGRYAILSKY